MQIYGILTNYNNIQKKHQNKGAYIYIDGRSTTLGNVARFIPNSHLNTVRKKNNCVFEEHKENKIVVCARVESLVDYIFNRV